MTHRACTLATVVAIICTGCVSDITSTTVMSPIPAANLTASTDDLSHTKVTPHLDAAIEPNTNLIWCASFQLAWNELMAEVGGPVELSGQPADADVLNRQDVTAASLDPADYVATAGRARRAASQARAAIRRQFGDTAVPQLLNRQRVPADGLLFYAYLQKRMHFPHAFDEVYPISFGRDTQHLGRTSQYKAFGIYQFIPLCERHRILSKQVRVIHHEFIPPRENLEHDFPRQHFVVELLTAQPNYRLILACVEPKPTLALTVKTTLARCWTPNTLVLDNDEAPPEPWKARNEAESQALSQRLSRISHLTFIESLRIPVLDFDIMASMEGLVGRTLQNTSSPWRGQPIVTAGQRVRLLLDRHGAVIESEAASSVFGGAPRSFNFDEPFLLLVLHEATEKPIAAMWIAHPEILVSEPASKRESNVFDLLDTD